MCRGTGCLTTPASAREAPIATSGFLCLIATPFKLPQKGWGFFVRIKKTLAMSGHSEGPSLFVRTHTRGRVIWPGVRWLTEKRARHL